MFRKFLAASGIAAGILTFAPLTAMAEPVPPTVHAETAAPVAEPSGAAEIVVAGLFGCTVLGLAGGIGVAAYRRRLGPDEN